MRSNRVASAKLMYSAAAARLMSIDRSMQERLQRNINSRIDASTSAEQ
jgi:hypothetical protein